MTTTVDASSLTFRGWLEPGRFFLAAALLFGVAFAAVTPPYQVPDEPAHFFRAYRVSEGRLDAVPKPGRAGEELPASLREIGGGPLLALPFHPERKIPPAALLAALRIPLTPERREPFFFPNTLQYTFVPYLPQAAGITAGRLFGVPALGLLYLARLANLLFGTLAIAFALRRLPAYAWLAALTALTPMALSLLASASADVTSIAAAFTLVSMAARLAWGEEPARRSDLLLLAAASAVLCASKPPYLPLALLAFLIPAARFPGGRKAGFLAAHLLLSLLAASWAVATSRAVGFIRFDGAVDPARQIHDSLTHPLRFFRVVAADYAVHAPRYLSETIGKLGWLDTRLPAFLVVAYLAVLGLLALVDTGPGIEVRPWQRGIAAAAVLAAMVLVSASQYAVWTPYRADFIQGVQGRYFLPVLPAAVWALHGRRWAERISPQRLGWALAAFSFLSSGIAAWSLASRYYGV